MSLSRNLFHPVVHVGGSVFDDFFDDFMNLDRHFRSIADRHGSRGNQVARREANELAFTPRVDMREQEKGYVVEADVPGMPMDKLKIETRENVLVLSGETGSQRSEKDGEGRVIYSERRSGKFCRHLQLPEDADLQSTKASWANGVLRIDVPKRVEMPASVRQIQITDASQKQ